MAAEHTYNDRVVRQFAIMTVAWGVVRFGKYLAQTHCRL
jgi:cbb3-type cytochrome oxidase subunit 1